MDFETEVIYNLEYNDIDNNNNTDENKNIIKRISSSKVPQVMSFNSNKNIKNLFKKNDLLNSTFTTKKDYQNVYSAGILPFSIKNKMVYFLLGKDPDGKWSDFGGRSEIDDNSRWDLTAAREFYEETIGSVMDVSTILTRLQAKKNYLRLKDKTLNGYPYYMYIIKIPYKETHRIIFKSTLSFIKYINSNDKKFDYKYFEKIEIQWVSSDTIFTSLKDPDSEYPLRSIFKRNLENNIKTIMEYIEPFIRSYDNDVDFMQ